LNALTLTVFCSFALVTVMLALFVVAVRRGDGDHEDRLSLLPLESDSRGDSKND
jgi:hypothetical protein